MEEHRPSAPIFSIQRREVIAVEHPMVIKNIDKGLKTFGTGEPHRRILDAKDDNSFPIYLRPEDPMCAPILSHNTATNCLLLKITVPKRTGRKRKRGSQDPYVDDGANTINNGTATTPRKEEHPSKILRTMKDNTGKYSVEAIAEIDNTHRFRGPADFYQSTANGKFMKNMEENFLGLRPERLRSFKFDPSTGVKENDEIIPPPIFSDHHLPFNWSFHQNPTSFVQKDTTTGELAYINTSRPASTEVTYLPGDCEDIPHAAPFEPPDDQRLKEVIQQLKMALDERPVWTRRAIMNHIKYGAADQTLKRAFQFSGYQFKGGPFRDALIKFGVDPRKDPSYRFYQTVFFHIYSEIEKKPGQPWKDIRSEYTKARVDNPDMLSHIFNGKSISLDGKLWQICDITDPMLRGVIDNAPVRDKCDSVMGWYCNGTWAKIRGIMKVKLMAIRAHKNLPDEVFKDTLAFPDHVDTDRREVYPPMPTVRLTEAEIKKLKEKGLWDSVFQSGATKAAKDARQHRRDRLNSAFHLRQEKEKQLTGTPRQSSPLKYASEEASEKNGNKRADRDINENTAPENTNQTPPGIPPQGMTAEEIRAYEQYLAEGLGNSPEDYDDDDDNDEMGDSENGDGFGFLDGDEDVIEEEDEEEEGEEDYEEGEETEDDLAFQNTMADEKVTHQMRYEMLKSTYHLQPVIKK